MFAEIVIVLPSTGLPFAYNWSVISVGLILCLFDSSSHTLVTVTFINFNVLITSNYVQITYNEGENFINLELKGNIMLEAVYSNCVEFIKWHNKNN